MKRIIYFICIVFLLSACTEEATPVPTQNGKSGGKEPVVKEPAAKSETLAGKLYFMKDNFIFSANTDGTGITQISTTGESEKPDANPSVSLDGKYITYSNNKTKIYMIASAGGEEKLVANQWFADHPVFSPDAAMVTFDMESYGMTIATAHTESGDFGKTYDSIYPRSWPHWSPTTKTVIATQISNNGEYFKLITIDLDTKDAEILIDDPNVDYFFATYNYDGDKIAVIRAPTGTEDYSLWIMNADGSNGKELVTDVTMARPAWAPDGKHIAFEKDNSIFIMPVDGGDAKEVIKGGTAPAWGK
ncbi:hypothetical protein CIB95_11815 [Lottiidibacillus patelloidae]|uniref:DUF5050 domain-containing protein n=1 Tax=Lottiidibacillus patelloidae TaxID=2670334 RepID=A0A263BRX8_9BACI|nr:lipoprotein [Lottiidibacillus patelloidae]OZM56455.1 hypothetical protein CIB95_11815 [Lottiidibacillus patelloidae]